MRKFLSLVLALVMTMSLVIVGTSAKTFTDDSDINYDEAVDVVSAVGIMDGYTGGNFDPAGVLTRGAAAKIICNMVLGPTTASALNADTAPFPDVPANHVFAGQIAYCAQKGIISGYGDGTFRPAGTLTGYAFTKMLLGALGYDSDIEGFTGPNWTINVAKLVSNLGLDDGNDEFSGTAAVTREEASLYAFNALQADVVEYGDKTSININGMEVNIGSKEAKAMQYKNSDTNDGGIKKDGIIQFAEQNFPKLKKLETTDSFARFSTKWTFKGDKIGTYVDTPDVSYTSNVKLGQIYSDLGMTQSDKNAEVYINGVKGSDVAVTKNNSVKIATNNGVNHGTVGDGSIVDVYYVEDDNDVRICVADVYVGTVTNVVTKNVAEPYIMIHNYSNIYDKDYSLIHTNGDFINDEGKFETEESFAEDDIVLFTFSQKNSTATGGGEIKAVWTPESVEGTVSKITYGKNIEVDGTTTYKYSHNIGFLDAGKDNEDALNTKSDYTVYLDDNGLVIYVTETEFNPDDYAFVLYLDSSSTKWGTDRAKLVTAAGKVIKVDTDENYAAETGADKLLGRVVLYRENSDGKYSLRLPAAGRHGEAGTVWGDAVTLTSDDEQGYQTPSSNGPASQKNSGVAHDGSTTFEMKNDRAVIKIDTNDSTKDLRANSETVFVTAETNTTGETVYQAYVGVKNAPSIASDGSSIGVAGSITDAKVEAFWATRSNGLVAFMFIDITEANYTNGKKDIVFFAGEKGMNNRVQNSDGKYYYTYNAVVDGEITTIDVQADLSMGAFTAGTKVNQVFTNVRYDNNGFVKAVDAVSGSYTAVAKTGVWKLSGKYSVGLGDPKNRETVSDSAKIYYVDTDGVITKKDSMSEVYTDPSAGYIAVFDSDNGDVAYLFIQEKAHDPSDSAGTKPTSVTALTLTKDSGKLKIEMTGATAGKKYTVKVEAKTEGTSTTVYNKEVTYAAGGVILDAVSIKADISYVVTVGDVVDIYRE